MVISKMPHHVIRWRVEYRIIHHWILLGRGSDGGWHWYKCNIAILDTHSYITVIYITPIIEYQWYCCHHKLNTKIEILCHNFPSNGPKMAWLVFSCQYNYKYCIVNCQIFKTRTNFSFDQKLFFTKIFFFCSCVFCNVLKFYSQDYLVFKNLTF